MAFLAAAQFSFSFPFLPKADQLPRRPFLVPTTSEALPAASEAFTLSLTAASDTLPAASDTLPAAYEALPAVLRPSQLSQNPFDP